MYYFYFFNFRAIYAFLDQHLVAGINKNEATRIRNTKFIYRQRSDVHLWNATLSLSLSPFPETFTLSLRRGRFIGLDSEFVTHDVPGTSTTISNTRHQTCLTYFATILDPTMTRYFAKIVVHERFIYLVHFFVVVFSPFFPFLFFSFFFFICFIDTKSYWNRTYVESFINIDTNILHTYEYSILMVNVSGKFEKSLETW